MLNLSKLSPEKLQKVVNPRQLDCFRMVALDMDGTLLDDDHQLTERTIEAVKAIERSGIVVLLATGRMTSAISNHLDRLGTPDLVVSHNGALVKGIRSGKIHYHKTLPHTVVARLLELLDEQNIITHLNCGDDVCLTEANPYSDRYAQDLEIDLTYVPSFSEIESEPTTVVLIDREDVLVHLIQALSREFSGQFAHVMSPWIEDVYRLQIRPSNISKGQAVLDVAKHFQVHPQEIISFGDNYNDLEMLTATGFSVAMGNAVPEIKEVADFITLPNHKDGVAYVLEALLDDASKAGYGGYNANRN